MRVEVCCNVAEWICLVVHQWWDAILDVVTAMIHGIEVGRGTSVKMVLQRGRDGLGGMKESEMIERKGSFT